MTRHHVAWRGLDEWRAEACQVERGEAGLHAVGVQIAPPYRLDYELVTDPSLITESLELQLREADGERRLSLRRAPDGAWTADGRPQEHVQGALDCDLALSPLTNFMPAARLAGSPVDHLMAWVSVPGLEVLRSEQRYEPVGPGEVRYVGLDHDFTAVLELDDDGLVTRYPGLAERV
jgi:uncharacterized protein